MVIKDMTADKSSIFDEINGKISSTESKISKVERDMQALQRQITRSLDIVDRKNTEIQNTVAELSKAKESGIKWIKNSVNNKLYSVSPFPMAWHDALKWARDNGADLATVADEKENQWLVNAFGGNTQYWIGLTDEKKEGEYVWTNGTVAKYFNWAAGEPDNYKGTQHHIAFNGGGAGKWNDRPGTEARIAIIEKK
jgi:hypothetical protein